MKWSNKLCFAASGSKLCQITTCKMASKIYMYKIYARQNIITLGSVIYCATMITLGLIDS